MKVQFEDVGRGKVSFVVDIPIVEGELSYQAMELACRHNGRLMSSDVDFSCDPDGQHGEVIVGGFRVVGRWKAVAE